MDEEPQPQDTHVEAPFDEPATWTADERRAFRQALEERRRRHVRASRLFAAVLIAVVAAGVLLRLSPDWWVPAVGAIALFGVGFRLVNWKCPRCGERLPTRRSTRVCLGCGAPLEG